LFKFVISWRDVTRREEKIVIIRVYITSITIITNVISLFHTNYLFNQFSVSFEMVILARGGELTLYNFFESLNLFSIESNRLENLYVNVADQ